MPAAPNVCSAQRPRNSSIERRKVARGPSPSYARTGSASSVTTLQPTPIRAATIFPPNGRYSSSTRSTAPTVHVTSVQAAMTPRRSRAARQPSAGRASSPSRRRASTAASATPQKSAANVAGYEARTLPISSTRRISVEPPAIARAHTNEPAPTRRLTLADTTGKTSQPPVLPHDAPRETQQPAGALPS